MNIGTRLKEARTAAKLTQEQAAEVLGVSRQTISNWENEKTYPDIMSIVKISDLYEISLDRLLKDEKALQPAEPEGEETKAVDMAIKESRQPVIIMAVAYLGIWVISILGFWLFAGNEHIAPYSLVHLWILLPVATFVIALFAGRQYGWRREAWMVAAGLGVMYMLAVYGTTGVADMLSLESLEEPQWEALPMGILVAIEGMAIGASLRYWKMHRLEKQRQRDDIDV